MTPPDPGALDFHPERPDTVDMNIYEIPGQLNEHQTRHLGTECEYSPQGDLTSALFMAICDLNDEDQFRYLCVSQNGQVQCIIGRQNDEIDVVPTREALERTPDFDATLTSAWNEAQSRHAKFMTFRRLGTPAADLQRMLNEPVSYPTLHGVRNDN